MASTILNLPNIRSIIMDRIVKTKEQDFHVTFMQEGAMYEGQEGVKVGIAKVGIDIKVQYSINPFDFAIKKLKGRNFAVGQAKDPDSQFYFALQKSKDGTVEGRLYSNGALMTLQSNKIMAV